MTPTLRVLGLISALLAISPLVAAQEDKPRVYISGAGNIDVRTNGSAVGGSHWALGSSHSTVGAHDQTMELAQHFTQECPTVTVTLNSPSADYTVALNHEAFHGVIFKNNQIMVTNRRGDLVMSNKTRAVSHSVKDSCSAILADWKANGRIEMPASPPPPSQAPSPATVATSAPPAAPTSPAAPAPASQVAMPTRATSNPQPTDTVASPEPTSLGEVARQLKAQKAAQKKQGKETPPSPPQNQ